MEKGCGLSRPAYSHSAGKPGVSEAGQQDGGQGAGQDVPRAPAGQGLPAGSWVPQPLGVPQLECPASAKAASCAAGCSCCPCGPRSWFQAQQGGPRGVVCVSVTTRTDRRLRIPRAQTQEEGEAVITPIGVATAPKPKSYYVLSTDMPSPCLVHPDRCSQAHNRSSDNINSGNRYQSAYSEPLLGAWDTLVEKQKKQNRQNPHLPGAYSPERDKP